MSSETKTTTTAWKTTDNRYVAYLDIMGFKDMVSRTNHKRIYEKLSLLSKSVEEIEKLKDIYVTQFSDSIVIFSKDSSIEVALKFFIGAGYIMCRSLELEMGIKGSIALGKITVNKEKQLYFGQPLIDAYLLEEDLCYYGVVVHHSAEKEITQLSIDPNPMRQSLFLEMPTKLKSGTINHFNINWPTISTTTDKEGYDTALKWLKNLKLTVSGAPRRYIDHSLEMIDMMKHKNAAIKKSKVKK